MRFERLNVKRIMSVVVFLGDSTSPRVYNINNIVLLCRRRRIVVSRLEFFYFIFF